VRRGGLVGCLITSGRFGGSKRKKKERTLLPGAPMERVADDDYAARGAAAASGGREHIECVDGGAQEHETRKSWADEDEELAAIGFSACSCGQLSCVSWSFLVFLLAIAIGIVVHDPSDAALLPGFFLAPMIVLYVIYWRKLRHKIPVDLVLQNFAFGFLPGACIVMLVELVLSGVFFLICFNDQLGGWFNAATHNGGGGLRSIADTEWVLLVAGSMRIRSLSFARPASILSSPAQWRTRLPAKNPASFLFANTMPQQAVREKPHTRGDATGIGSVVVGGGAGTDPSGQQVDPIAVLSQMYGINIVRTPGLYLFIFLLSYVVAAGTVRMRSCVRNGVCACVRVRVSVFLLLRVLVCASLQRCICLSV